MQRISSPTPLPSRFRLRRAELASLAHNLRALSPQRIAILGGPRSGKSTLAAALSDYYRVPVNGTDELMGLGWSESSEAASRWFDRPGPWICEGVVMPRALRKWLERVPDRSPADLVIWVNEAVDARIIGQEVMAKGCATVWNEILPAVVERGTRVLQP